MPQHSSTDMVPRFTTALTDGSNITGALHVTDAARTKSGNIYFQDSNIYSAGVDGFLPRLPQRFLNSGLITPKMHSALLSALGGDPLSPAAGLEAVRLEQITLDELNIVHRELLLSAIGAMTTWPEFRTKFRPNVNTNSFTIDPLPPAKIMKAVSRRLHTWSTMWEGVAPGVPAQLAVPVRTQGSVPVQSNDDIIAVLNAVDGIRTVDEIAGSCGMTRFETGHILLPLVRENVLIMTRPGFTSAPVFPIFPLLEADATLLAKELRKNDMQDGIDSTIEADKREAEVATIPPEPEHAGSNDLQVHVDAPKAGLPLIAPTGLRQPQAPIEPVGDYASQWQPQQDSIEGAHLPGLGVPMMPPRMRHHAEDDQPESANERAVEFVDTVADSELDFITELGSAVEAEVKIEHDRFDDDGGPHEMVDVVDVFVEAQPAADEQDTGFVTQDDGSEGVEYAEVVDLEDEIGSAGDPIDAADSVPEIEGFGVGAELSANESDLREFDWAAVDKSELEDADSTEVGASSEGVEEGLEVAASVSDTWADRERGARAHMALINETQERRRRTAAVNHARETVEQVEAQRVAVTEYINEANSAMMEGSEAVTLAEVGKADTDRDRISLELTAAEAVTATAHSFSAVLFTADEVTESRHALDLATAAHEEAQNRSQVAQNSHADATECSDATSLKLASIVQSNDEATLHLAQSLEYIEELAKCLADATERLSVVDEDQAVGSQNLADAEQYLAELG